jgi:hypothetical protein
MADTKTLQQLNTEIVALVDELSGMQAKQERLRELVRQRTDLEQQLLGAPANGPHRGGGRKRAKANDQAAP